MAGATTLSAGQFTSAYGTTIADTTTVAVTGRTKVIAQVSWWGGDSTTLASVTDSAGNTWTVHTQLGGAVRRLALASCDVASGMASGVVVTATFSGLSESRGIRVCAIDGLTTNAASGVDTSGTRASTSAATGTITLTTAYARDVIVMGTSKEFNSNNVVPSGAAVEVFDWSNADNGLQVQYLVTSATGSNATTNTWTGASNNTAVAVAFKILSDGSYASEVFADLPLTYLRMGDPSGTTALDSSGNNRPGTYAGTPSLNQTSLVPSDLTNGCVDFDGFNDVVTIANAAWQVPAGAFSAKIRFNLDTVTGSFLLAGRANGAAANSSIWGLFVINGKLVCQVADTLDVWGSATSVTTLLTGVTYEGGFYFDGSNVKCYLDGALEATTSFAGRTIRTSGVGITIGNLNGAAFTNGRLDEFAMFGSGLSDSRFAAQYAAGLAYAGQGKFFQFF